MANDKTIPEILQVVGGKGRGAGDKDQDAPLDPFAEAMRVQAESEIWDMRRSALHKITAENEAATLEAQSRAERVREESRQRDELRRQGIAPPIPQALVSSSSATDPWMKELAGVLGKVFGGIVDSQGTANKLLLEQAESNLRQLGGLRDLMLTGGLGGEKGHTLGEALGELSQLQSLVEQMASRGAPAVAVSDATAMIRIKEIELQQRNHELDMQAQLARDQRDFDLKLEEMRQNAEGRKAAGTQWATIGKMVEEAARNVSAGGGAVGPGVGAASAVEGPASPPAPRPSTVQTPCPACGQTIVFDPRARQVSCPSCGGLFSVGNQPPPAPAPSSFSQPPLHSPAPHQSRGDEAIQDVFSGDEDIVAPEPEGESGGEMTLAWD